MKLDPRLKNFIQTTSLKYLKDFFMGVLPQDNKDVYESNTASLNWPGVWQDFFSPLVGLLVTSGAKGQHFRSV